MKRALLTIISVTLLFAAAYAQQAEVDMDAETSQVAAVLDNLVKALETGDMELLSTLYAHDPDIMNIGTDASEWMVGWDALEELMRKQFETTETTGITIRERMIKVHESGKVARFAEMIDWNLIAEGEALQLEGLRETGVLEKRDGSWVLVQLHFSMPAVD